MLADKLGEVTLEELENGVIKADEKTVMEWVNKNISTGKIGQYISILKKEGKI
jgi:hypothetical protein